MSFPFDQRIVPDKLVVGITENMCYFTYYETKGVKNPVTDLNSKHSWTQWSENKDDPLIIDNKFLSGYVLGGVNGRYSNDANNSENLMITHPEADSNFEISLSRFLEICKHTDIKKGELMNEFIITKSRDLITRDEYNDLVYEADEKEAEKQAKKEQLSNTKVTPKNQVVGGIYEDNSGVRNTYFGSFTVGGEQRHLYLAWNYGGWDTTIPTTTKMMEMVQGMNCGLFYHLKNKKTMYTLKKPMRNFFKNYTTEELQVLVAQAEYGTEYDNGYSFGFGVVKNKKTRPHYWTGLNHNNKSTVKVNFLTEYQDQQK